MKYIIIPILIFSSLGFASCSVDLNSKSPVSNYLDRVTASDNLISEKRTVDRFDAIEVSSAISVTVNDGDYTGELTIDAPDNILSRIETVVENGVLKMKIKGTVSLQNQKIKVNFSHKKLRSFDISGASNVTVLPTLKVDKLNVDLSGASVLKVDVVANEISVDNSGASSMKISGNAQNLLLQVSGASSFNAKDLKAANVTVDCSGASSATVWAVDNLKAESSGASSVKYVSQNGLKTQVDTSGMSTIKSINK